MVKQALENASGEVPKSFKGRRRAQKNKALNILSRTRQTQTCMCVIWDDDIPRSMDSQAYLHHNTLRRSDVHVQLYV